MNNEFAQFSLLISQHTPSDGGTGGRRTPSDGGTGGRRTPSDGGTGGRK